MSTLIEFGERVDGFSVRVLNERAVRAGAGLLFFVAIIAFMNAWLMGNFRPTRVFVIAFLIDFTVRVFVNPRFAPSLIVGQWIVRKQQPEWTGAPQKRFAWAIGFFLAVTMVYLIVLHNMMGPFNLIICVTCLLFLFFETAFGICLGCKIYNAFNKEKAQLCPGGVCEPLPAIYSGTNLMQLAIVAGFALMVGGVARWVDPADQPTAQSSSRLGESTNSPPADPAEIERCKVPEFAKALGHEEKWKLHNNCK